MPLLVRGSLISPTDKLNYDPIPHALIYVGDDGIIKSIKQIAPADALETEDAFLAAVGHHGKCEKLKLARGEFLIPGFVDTHCHPPQFPNIGAGQDLELLEWLNNVIFPMEAKFKDLDFATKAYAKSVRRFIDAGTTTCSYYGTLHLDASKKLARIVHDFGQRAFVGKCNMDRESPDYYIEKTAESVPDTEKLIEYIRSLPHANDGEPYVYPVVTPRFAISTTETLLEALQVLVGSDKSLAIQTHISENLAEVQKVKDLFQHLWPGEPVTYAQVYDHYDLLRHNTILAHAVHLEESELELVKKRKCGISHCPTSNFNLTSGVAKIGDMLDRGIKVGLGTDVSGGYSPSILNTVQNAAIAAKVVAFTSPASRNPNNTFASKPLPVATLFWLATLGGAEVCNLEHKIGSLEVGKAFDAIVVNIRNTHRHSHHYVSPHNPNLWGVGDDEDVGLEVTRGEDEEMDEETKLKKELDAMLERLLFCGDDRNLRRVYVQGRWIGGTEHPAKHKED